MESRSDIPSPPPAQVRSQSRRGSPPSPPSPLRNEVFFPDPTDEGNEDKESLPPYSAYPEPSRPPQAYGSSPEAGITTADYNIASVQGNRNGAGNHTRIANAAVVGTSSPEIQSQSQFRRFFRDSPGSRRRQRIAAGRKMTPICRPCSLFIALIMIVLLVLFCVKKIGWTYRRSVFE